MEDNRAALKAIKASDRIVQIGSQRRSGANYHAADDFIKSGKFGPITMVELNLECKPARPLAQAGFGAIAKRRRYRLETIFIEPAF